MNMEINKIHCIDCIEGLKQMESESVDLIVSDPPYYRIMKEHYDHSKKYDWDDRWKNFDEYKKWLSDVNKECSRVLKSNGSMFLFCDDIRAAHVQIVAEECFNILNHIIWVKPQNLPIKGWRAYLKFCPITERILFMDKKDNNGTSASGLQQIYNNADCFHEIKDYLLDEKARAMSDLGLDETAFKKWFSELTRTKRMDYHYFGDYQWTFPTEKIYKKMQESGYWTRPLDQSIEEKNSLMQEYAELRKEYEKMRRPFRQSKNYTDVWTYDITSTYVKCIHPTQKPVPMIRRMIKTCTNEGAIVLDPFMGSGTTAIAAIDCQRDFIGFESDPEMCEKANLRVNERMKTTNLKEWF